MVYLYRHTSTCHSHACLPQCTSPNLEIQWFSILSQRNVIAWKGLLPTPFFGFCFFQSAAKHHSPCWEFLVIEPEIVALCFEPSTKATDPALSFLPLAFLSILQTHFPTLSILWLSLCSDDFILENQFIIQINCLCILAELSIHQ